MPDRYESIRSLPFPTLAGLLGLDLQRFKRRKTDWQGYCPVHQSKTNNNCFAYADDGRFHCFSCEAKGRGGIDLYKAVRNVGFQAAVEALGATPVETAIAPVKDAPETESSVLRPLEKDTWRKFQVPCEWLEKRVPDAGVRKEYGIFCYNNPARKSAYSGRVMIPVKDVEGILYGYLGRDTNTANSPADTPKYLFPKSLPKSAFLFGAAEIRASQPLPLKVVYLVESPFAVLKFASMGFHALSPYGWSVSEEQSTLLCSLAKGVILLPDRNKHEEALTHLGRLGTRLWVRLPPLPAGIDDPEQLSREQVLAL